MVGLALLTVVMAASLCGLAWEAVAWMHEAPSPSAMLLPGEHPQPPSLDHPFGTDPLGRDMLARSLVGGVVSLGVGLAAATISILIGTAWGIVSGYAGRGTDTVMMRIVDVLYGLPYILVVILLMVVIPDEPLGFWKTEAAPEGALVIGSMWIRTAVLLAAIGGVSWLTMARVVRGQVLSLRESEFVQAARALGSPARRIIVREMLPNLAGTILVCATLTVPLAILQESFLSFLGLGIRPPLASWGTLASDAIGQLNPIRVYWWLLAMPCALLGATLLGLNFVGDGLRDAFDPRSK
jgi:ABC-type dipeptide/oligopeptide/nickel transport system permease subunit